MPDAQPISTLTRGFDLPDDLLETLSFVSRDMGVKPQRFLTAH